VSKETYYNLDDFIADILAFSVAIKPEEEEVAAVSSGHKVRLYPVLLTSLLRHLIMYICIVFMFIFSKSPRWWLPVS
jgi:hypothetical protein